jgi:FkbM family methyltransferase
MKTYTKPCRYGTFILLYGDMISNYVNMYGEWSETEVELFKAILPPDGNVIEVGANIGMHAIPLSRICHAGQVFCYEPQRPIFHILCGNIALNGRLNIIARHMAVGGEAGRIKIATSNYDAAWNYGSFSVASGFNTEGEYQAKTGTDMVEMVALDSDSALQNLSRVDMLKIDAEGFEPNVLAGARGLIQRHQPYVFSEANNPAVTDKIIAEMATHGYVGYWFANQRFRPANYNTCAFKLNGYDINIIFAPRDRQFPGCTRLKQAVGFADINQGVVPIVGPYEG